MSEAKAYPSGASFTGLYMRLMLIGLLDFQFILKKYLSNGNGKEYNYGTVRVSNSLTK